MAARRRLLAVTVVLMLCAGPPAHAARSPKPSGPRARLELLSVTGIPLGRGERLWSFRVDMLRARIVSLCGFPDGWDMKLANYADAAVYRDGGGYVEGGAMFDHNALAPQATGVLNRFVLIRPDGPAPPKLDGGYTVQYGAKGEARRRFTAASFRTDPASRCPAQAARGAGR